MENKGTGRVCLRALPFLMALSGSVCLTPLWASEAVKPSEEVLVQAQKKKDFRCRKRRNRRAGDWCFCTD